MTQMAKILSVLRLQSKQSSGISISLVALNSWCFFTGQVSGRAVHILLSSSASLYTDQVKALLAQDSEPRFQRLVLLDLPPEVLGHILDFVDVGGARLLAATCHVLRELAILYAFRVGICVIIPPTCD